MFMCFFLACTCLVLWFMWFVDVGMNFVQTPAGLVTWPSLFTFGFEFYFFYFVIFTSFKRAFIFGTF